MPTGIVKVFGETYKVIAIQLKGGISLRRAQEDVIYVDEGIVIEDDEELYEEFMKGEEVIILSGEKMGLTMD